MISIVYRNENNIPVNKQAVSAFFKDHEIVTPIVVNKKSIGNISIDYFKKATEEIRQLDNSSDYLIMPVVYYERVCLAIKRSKIDSLPTKYKKLIRFIMHMTKLNKELSIAIIEKMRQERFINITGDQVKYFKGVNSPL